ncbi:hypothetical protein EVAR_32809_1 [Eumeta japonica]|uniref:Uncharacterized protein n=1 Tax=Eumeta variegata TaxID=151549 RepID=A0A4C1WF86_EUMVA|nr:hypothetical protein EVAR_32809_1 [Eumeta japonica]
MSKHRISPRNQQTVFFCICVISLNRMISRNGAPKKRSAVVGSGVKVKTVHKYWHPTRGSARWKINSARAQGGAARLFAQRRPPQHGAIALA